MPRKFCYLAAACVLLFSGTSDVKAEISLSDEQEVYRIGVAEFEAVALASENLYIGASFPLLIYEELARVDYHQFSVEDIDGYRQLFVERERRRLANDRDRALVALDSAFLSNSDISAATDRVQQAIDLLAELDSVSLDSIEIVSSKPVGMAELSGQNLLPQVVSDPAKLVEDHQLDLLVYGLVEEIETYLFVDVYVFSTARGRSTLFRSGFSRERLIESTEKLIGEIVGIALGREWAALTVSAVPESSEIYVDGVFRGTGKTSIPFLRPGGHDVQVQDYGYSTYEESIDLLPTESGEISATLVETGGTGTTIITTPGGADVYALSQWQGVTPAHLPPGMVNVQGMIRKEGYADFLVPVLPPEQDSVEIQLLPNVLNRRQLMDDQRSDFYRVLAAFVLSLPLPIYFLDATNTLTLSYINEAEQSASERNVVEALRLLDARQVNLTAYIGTLFISAALLTDAIIELLRFIDLVDLSTF